MSLSSGAGGGGQPAAPEEGDYIINWHLQYNAQIFLQMETQLKSMTDQIKAELMKLKVDGDFIKERLPGPHNNLSRLKNEDRDLRSVLDPLNKAADLCRMVAQRSAQRLI